MNWFKTNKLKVGAGFMAFAPTALMLPDPHHYIAVGLGFIGAFLIGAGALPSDYHVRAADTIVEPIKSSQVSKLDA